MVRSRRSQQQGESASISEGVWAAHPSPLGPSVAEGDHTRPRPQVEGPQPYRGPGPPAGTTTAVDVQGWEGPAASLAVRGESQPLATPSPLPLPHCQVLKWVWGLTDGGHRSHGRSGVVVTCSLMWPPTQEGARCLCEVARATVGTREAGR